MLALTIKFHHERHPGTCCDPHALGMMPRTAARGTERLTLTCCSAPALGACSASEPKAPMHADHPFYTVPHGRAGLTLEEWASICHRLMVCAPHTVRNRPARLHTTPSSTAQRHLGALSGHMMRRASRIPPHLSHAGLANAGPAAATPSPACAPHTALPAHHASATGLHGTQQSGTEGKQYKFLTFSPITSRLLLCLLGRHSSKCGTSGTSSERAGGTHIHSFLDGVNPYPGLQNY